MGQHALDSQQRGLDLRGEDVEALDDEHVVAAPTDPPNPPQRAAARARLGHDGRAVPRAVTDQRHGLFAERGEDQFAFLPIGEQISAQRIDDFGVQVVLEDMQPVLMAAFGAHAGSDHLGQAVEIVGFDSRRIFNLPARGLAPLGDKDSARKGSWRRLMPAFSARSARCRK